jgi:predicted transcriptional regulator
MLLLHSLNLAELLLLEAILQNPGIGSRSLEEILGVSRTTLRRRVLPLEQQQLVRRQKNGQEYCHYGENYTQQDIDACLSHLRSPAVDNTIVAIAPLLNLVADYCNNQSNLLKTLSNQIRTLIGHE